jgi:hypothetical protein
MRRNKTASWTKNRKQGKQMKKELALLAVVWAVILSLIPDAATSPGSVPKNPDVVTLDSLAKKYTPVVFTHARHTGFAANCGACHHHHHNSTCKDCHTLNASVTNNFPACKNCHAARDRSSPGMPGLEVAYHRACFECHRGMGRLGVEPGGCNEICHTVKRPAGK